MLPLFLSDVFCLFTVESLPALPSSSPGSLPQLPPVALPSLTPFPQCFTCVSITAYNTPCAYWFMRQFPWKAASLRCKGMEDKAISLIICVSPAIKPGKVLATGSYVIIQAERTNYWMTSYVCYKFLSHGKIRKIPSPTFIYGRGSSTEGLVYGFENVIQRNSKVYLWVIWDEVKPQFPLP